MVIAVLAGAVAVGLVAWVLFTLLSEWAEKETYVSADYNAGESLDDWEPPDMSDG